MATPPTRVSYGASVFNTNTTPKTVSITTQVGDRVVVMVLGESALSGAVTTAPTGNSETYTQVATLGTDGNNARAIAWTMTATSAATFNVSAVRPSTNANPHWGVGVWVYRGSDGFGTIGAPTVGSTSNSVTLTTTGANSALVVGSADWLTVDGTSRTARTVNGSTGSEETYLLDSGAYTLYQQRYDDTGSIGSVTAGYSAPAGQQSAIIAVEILGTTPAATAAGRFPSQQIGVPFTTPGLRPFAQPLQLQGDASGAQFPRLDETGAGNDTATVAAAVPLTETASAVDATAVTAAVPLTETAAGADSATVTAAAPLAETAAGADSLTVTVPVSLTDTGTADDGTLTVPAAVPLPETSSVDDVLTVAVAAVIADTATGTDLLSVQSDSVIVTDANQAQPGFPWLLTSWRTSAGQVYGDATFSGGVQVVSLDDAGTGVDALTATVTVPAADVATAADDAVVTAAVPLSDGGTATDALSVSAGAGTDAYQAAPSIAWLFTSPRAASQQNIGDTFSGPSALAETAIGSDTLSVAPAVPLGEAGSGGDALSVSATVSLTETATTADTLNAMATVSLSDTAAADDSLSVQVTGGADQNQWLPPQKWGITRPGVAMDPPALQLLGDMSGSNQVNLTESASASDSLTISVAVVLTETAAGADALATTVAVPLSELVSAADALALATVVLLTETASAADICTISGQGIQGQGHGGGGHSAVGNVYPRSTGSIIGSVG